MVIGFNMLTFPISTGFTIWHNKRMSEENLQHLKTSSQACSWSIHQQSVLLSIYLPFWFHFTVKASRSWSPPTSLPLQTRLKHILMSPCLQFQTHCGQNGNRLTDICCDCHCLLRFVRKSSGLSSSLIIAAEMDESCIVTLLKAICKYYTRIGVILLTGHAQCWKGAKFEVDGDSMSWNKNKQIQVFERINMSNKKVGKGSVWRGWRSFQ